MDRKLALQKTSYTTRRQFPSPGDEPIFVKRFTSETEAQFLQNAVGSVFLRLQGRIANTRAGNPEPPFGLGKLTTTIAPDSGT
jgi:hypothetical protein